MHTDRCGNTCRQKCCAKGSGREVKIQEFRHRGTANVEPEMYDCTGNNWSHWNSNEKLKEKFGSCTRKTLDRFTTKNSYTWNITRNTESTAVWRLKPERWGSPLVQEKYQEEMPVTRDDDDDDDDDNDNIVIKLQHVRRRYLRQKIHQREWYGQDRQKKWTNDKKY